MLKGFVILAAKSQDKILWKKYLYGNKNSSSLTKLNALELPPWKNKKSITCQVMPLLSISLHYAGMDMC
jgi:hypothetical protein